MKQPVIIKLWPKLLIWGTALGVQLPINCLAQSLTGAPAKIEVVTESTAVTANSTAKLRVNLLDPENKPANAKKDVTIQVEGQLPSGNTQTSTVVVKAGESSGTVEMPAKEPGLVKVLASTPELASGGSVLNVRATHRDEPFNSATPSTSASPSQASPMPSVKPSASPTAWLMLHFTRRLACIGLDGMLAMAMAEGQSAMLSASSSSTQEPPAAPLTSGRVDWNPALTFMCVPERKIWADGKDAATIYANLPPDQVAPWDMLIYAMSSVGPLEPNPLVIPKGQNAGKARLTCDRPAAVWVRFMSSVPWAKGVSGLPLKIEFGPTAVKVRPNPPNIGLFESTEVAVQLVDANGNSVIDDQKREVSVVIESGSGGLDLTSLTIEPNHSRVTTQFRPTLPGTVRLLAESPNLRADEKELFVATPTLILILCAAGGLIGGLVAYFIDTAAKRARIFIGVVTGFVLYWLLVFGLILIPHFPHIAVFNPFSAAILGIFGGWLGTKVFSIGLQKIGINI